jgi:hypothetical protein
MDVIADPARLSKLNLAVLRAWFSRVHFHRARPPRQNQFADSDPNYRPPDIAPRVA